MIKRVLILKDKFPLVNKSYEPGQQPAAGNDLGEYQPIIDSISQKAIIGQQIEEVIGNQKLTYKKSRCIGNHASRIDQSILCRFSTRLH